MRRWIIQLVFLIAQNPFIQNFLTGTIYRGPSKAVCVPSLHCYSCPSAPFACPVGTIQYVIEYARMIPYYALGVIAAVGAVFGSAPCAYFCPFGFLQELLWKISPFRSRMRLPKIFRYLKWGVLVVTVIAIPLWKHIPAFCAYICPAGTLEAGIPILAANPGFRDSAGYVFVWKLLLLIVLLVYMMREQRPFCRYLCPLGLMTGLFNRVSLLQMKLDSVKCMKCGVCAKTCPMGLDLPKELNSIDCIKCGECTRGCPPKVQAITRSWGG